MTRPLSFKADGSPMGAVGLRMELPADPGIDDQWVGYVEWQRSAPSTTICAVYWSSIAAPASLTQFASYARELAGRCLRGDPSVHVLALSDGRTVAPIIAFDVPAMKIPDTYSESDWVTDAG